MDMEVIKSKLDMAGQRYSGLLLQMIKHMLELSPEVRKRCSDLRDMLRPYEG